MARDVERSRRRPSLAAAAWSGLGILAAYLLLRFVIGVTKGLLLWVLPVLAAGFVAEALPERVSGRVRLVVGVVVLAAAYALERQVPGLR